MNSRGTPENLIPSQPGNTNALRHGVHSRRLIQARASEIESSLTQSFTFNPTESLALREAARCMAILDAIDIDLDQPGLVDKRGEPRYLLNHRYRISRQLDHWLTRISETIERQTADGEAPSSTNRSSYLHELQRIALGKDPRASVRDRLFALRELLKLEEEDPGETPEEDELLPGVTRRGNIMVFPWRPSQVPPNAAQPSDESQ